MDLSRRETYDQTITWASGLPETTLLLALAGKLNKNLKVTGDISYNGYKLNEFVAHKASAYVSQFDHHFFELTVRETLDFAARFQGILLEGEQKLLTKSSEGKNKLELSLN